ncbi:MAG: DoxX-like family protein [Ginsengibacter sp.]
MPRTIAALNTLLPYLSISFVKMTRHKLINYCIATVWIVNGLFCKVLNLVPRHQEIVSRILENDHARLLTFLIGISEIAMAVWILSGLWTRLNVITQILVIAVMNSLEFFLAPDLLLWGKLNALFAFLFILLIYYNEFRLNKNIQTA